ncbi:Alpha-galactosidase GH36 [Thermobacillus xylanilyticus]|uniref:Alpha-galactosidase GH36 n=1 Tax=Thermobacillus xylanilyticus TaxID=76633 RepID=A0ABM8UZG0_THEXY|nr:Alpha-galactosidase GH36 [Thermobacillus xylanilyticus]
MRGIGVSVRLEGGERRKLALHRVERQEGAACAEYVHVYQDDEEAKEAVVRLTLRCCPEGVAAFVEGEIVRSNDFGDRRALSPDDGLLIHIGALDELQGVLANYQHKDWWTRPHFDSDLRALPERTVSLLWRTPSAYFQLLPVTGPAYRADLQADGRAGGLAVRIFSGQGGMTSCRTLAFVLGGGENPYLLPERNVTLALRHLNGQTLPRNAKVYPEILDYLGWCSWDAFYHEVDEKGLLAKAEELQRLGLPVRWVMIDDGWSEVRDRKLYGMDADPAKFPRGLAHTIEALKRQYGIRWVGVWHTIAGYWDGIHPDSEMARELREYLFTTRRGNVMPYPDAGRGFGFWHAWHGYLARQGVDFVKVDSQSAVHNFLRHHLPVGQAASAAHTALEASAALHFDRTIINCMGMSAENIWHRPVSAVSRNSDDFVPQERHGFREHALQNAYNSYYHGAWYWGDWDMFWTENHDDVQNMVLRAVSGGPVYFSDALGRTDPARVWPLIFRDGKIIRCDRTANPTPDCLMRSPISEPLPLKLWNKAGRAGVVAAFHICEAQTDVQGAISLDDVPDMTADSAWVYEHFSRTAVRLARGQSLPFALQAEQCRLFLLVPDRGAVTPIGLADKLVSSAAVERQWEEGKSCMVRLREGGTFIFAADQPPSSVRANGETLKWSPSACPSLYEADCSHLHGAVTLEIVRA